MKKKLLIFHTCIAPYRIDLFNAFNALFDMRFCFFLHGLYPKIEKQFDFSPTFIDKKKGRFYWIKGIISQLRLFEPDVVLCSEFNVVTLIVVLFKFLTLKKYRIISIVDDSYDMVVMGKSFSWKHIWGSRILMPFIDNVINVEPKVTEYYRQKFGKGVYMPIIVDENKARARLQRILPISQEYVKKYNLEGKKVLLYVGRLVDVKNISFAINAFFKANLKNSIFVIVGDGPEKEKLFSLVNGRKNVIFTGRLEGNALYAWYNIAQIFTLQSTLEPFGAVTNEALLGGCYCLVSNLAGSNCLIKENVNGNIVDPYDEMSYVNLLRNAFNKKKPIVLPIVLRDDGMQDKFADCFKNMIAGVMK